MRNTIIALFVAAMIVAAPIAPACEAGADEPNPRGPLATPRGTVHVPIRSASSADALEAFVEGEGSFSSGVATHRIYFWIREGDNLILRST